MTDNNYGSWTPDAVKKDMVLGSDKNSVEIMKLKEGRTIMRFLPPASDGSPFSIVWQHYVENTDGTRLVFPCPMKMHRNTCPVCTEANRLSRTGNPADREMAYQLWPKMRVFSEVVDMEEPNKGVQIIAFGKTIYEQLMSIRTDKRLGGDFTDPEDGFEIIIDRTGTGKFDTKYTVRSDKINASAIENWDWLEMRADLGRFSSAAPNHVLEDAQRALGLDVGTIIDIPVTHKAVITNVADDIDGLK